MMQSSPELLAKLEALAESLRALLAGDLLSADIVLGELTINVRREAIAVVMAKLRDDPRCAFHQLMDICGVDYPERAERFEVVYNLLSLPHNLRLRVKVTADENALVPTVTGVFNAAGWFERECWDLYGVRFAGHPDLRRILTDYGFEGHPLRKDFPLTGYTEVRYDAAQQRIVYEPVKLMQDFRNFDYTSPWEGMTDVMLPGDEKAANPNAAKVKP